MKKIPVACAIVMFTCLIVSSVHADPNLYFDFNKDGRYDTKWKLDSTTKEKVLVEIYIDDWDKSLFSDEPIFGARLFFYYDETQIQVNALNSFPNDTENDGIFDSSFSNFYDLGDGKIELSVANFNCINITGSVLLFSLELECIAEGTSYIYIKTDLNDNAGGAIVPGGPDCTSAHSEDCGEGKAQLINSPKGEGIDENCPVTQLLGEKDPRLHCIRKFRDDVLAKSAYGRSLIELYYKSGKTINALLAENPAIKKYSKKILEYYMDAIWK